MPEFTQINGQLVIRSVSGSDDLYLLDGSYEKSIEVSSDVEAINIIASISDIGTIVDPIDKFVVINAVLVGSVEIRNPYGFNDLISVMLSGYVEQEVSSYEEGECISLSLRLEDIVEYSDFHTTSPIDINDVSGRVLFHTIAVQRGIYSKDGLDTYTLYTDTITLNIHEVIATLSNDVMPIYIFGGDIDDNTTDDPDEDRHLYTSISEYSNNIPSLLTSEFFFSSGLQVTDLYAIGNLVETNPNGFEARITYFPSNTYEFDNNEVLEVAVIVKDDGIEYFYDGFMRVPDGEFKQAILVTNRDNSTVTLAINSEEEVVINSNGILEPNGEPVQVRIIGASQFDSVPPFEPPPMLA